MGVTTLDNVKPKGLGIRHAQVLLIFFAMLIAFSMRANMSMAIVDMTDESKAPHFDWPGSKKSVILSSFFWGYIVLQVPAGELSGRLGGKLLITTAISVNSLVSLLTPTAAYIGGWQLVCACRVLQGLTQALIYPSVHHLVSQWVPREEKGILTTIAYAEYKRSLDQHGVAIINQVSAAPTILFYFTGYFTISTEQCFAAVYGRQTVKYLAYGGQLGISLQLMVAGFLAEAWRWPAIFYSGGILGAVWTVIYLIFGADSPETSKYISTAEVEYIQKSLMRVGGQKKYPTPWWDIMTCLPFWAVIVAHCGQNWGFFTLMTEMPTYMDKVLGVKLEKNGVLSSLPYLAMFSLSFPMGLMTDVIIKHRWLSVANTRKLFNSIGLWGPGIALIVLSYAPGNNPIVAVALLTVAVGINAGQYLGYMLVHIDLAPNFSGNLMGVTNFLANIVSIIAPLVCGAIIDGKENDASVWRIVFFVSAGVYFVTNLFFVLFSTSERQPWNEPKEINVEMKAPEKAVTTDEKY